MKRIVTLVFSVIILFPCIASNAYGATVTPVQNVASTTPKTLTVAETLQKAKDTADAEARLAAQARDAEVAAEIESDRLAQVAKDAANGTQVVPTTTVPTAREAEVAAEVESDRLAQIAKDASNAGINVPLDNQAPAAPATAVWLDGTKSTQVGVELYAYLTPSANVTGILNTAIRLHGSNASNTCVYFSTEAMRHIGVNISTSTCDTWQYLNYMRARGWSPTYDIKKLSKGSICFTTNDSNGNPTHTFIFMGWVTAGDYTVAYVADNQSYAVHTRSMVATNQTDAFSFFMQN